MKKICAFALLLPLTVATFARQAVNELMNVTINGPQTVMVCKIDSKNGIMHSTWTFNGALLKMGDAFTLIASNPSKLLGTSDGSGQEIQFHAYCGGDQTMLNSINLDLLSMQTSDCDNSFLPDYACSPPTATGDDITFTITKASK